MTLLKNQFTTKNTGLQNYFIQRMHKEQKIVKSIEIHFRFLIAVEVQKGNEKGEIFFRIQSLKIKKFFRRNQIKKEKRK